MRRQLSYTLCASPVSLQRRRRDQGKADLKEFKYTVIVFVVLKVKLAPMSTNTILLCRLSVADTWHQSRTKYPKSNSAFRRAALSLIETKSGCRNGGNSGSMYPDVCVGDNCPLGNIPCNPSGCNPNSQITSISSDSMRNRISWTGSTRTRWS
jgi:hypothetical protein